MDTRLFSTTRAIANDAAIVIGNTAAIVPIVVPTRPRVIGLIATNKIMNGIGLIMLTSIFKMENTTLFSNMLPSLVTKNIKPIVIPRTLANTSVRKTIIIVSPVASTIFGQNVVQSTFIIKHHLSYLYLFFKLLNSFFNNYMITY